VNFLVLMVRYSGEPGGQNSFSCSLSAWDLLVELGKAFGWQPLGTTYVPAALSKPAVSPARHNYQPGEAQDRKQVERDDAVNWAAALAAAKRSPHLGDMIGSRPRVAVLHPDALAEKVTSANAPFDVVMDEFIEYAFGGPFLFAAEAVYEPATE
jgi:hypothetical protein